MITLLTEILQNKCLRPHRLWERFKRLNLIWIGKFRIWTGKFEKINPERALTVAIYAEMKFEKYGCNVVFFCKFPKKRKKFALPPLTLMKSEENEQSWSGFGARSPTKYVKNDGVVFNYHHSLAQLCKYSARSQFEQHFFVIECVLWQKTIAWKLSVV